MRDIIGLYLDPPDNALVFSVDEKTSKGTDNVLVDLGFEDAGELSVKATIALKLNELIDKRRLSMSRLLCNPRAVHTRLVLLLQPNALTLRKAKADRPGALLAVGNYFRAAA